MTPTPQQLSRSLIDLGRGYEAEILGVVPNPALGAHIKTQAKRIADRVRDDDPRLAAFAPFTDAAGYVWMPETLHDYWGAASALHWSFERWLTELAYTLTHHKPYVEGGLAELEEAGATADRLRDQGFRPVVADGNANLILKRDVKAAE